ncbi:hypothetical protein FQR65_LT03190 [Abscondita terminalis]|nr:hypothetical protein FQR65_LT03190 [Abscondita terminalis]
MLLIKVFQDTCAQANSFGTDMHNVQSRVKDEKSMRDISRYSLLLLHKRLSFDLFGLFPIDFTVIFSVSLFGNAI